MSHIVGRVNFEHIVAGVLRLITEPAKYETLRSFIKPSLFYVNDNTDPVISLRETLKVMDITCKEYQPEKMTLDFIEVEIKTRIIDNLKAEKTQQHFINWRNNESIIAKMKDDGCWLSFLEFLKALQFYDASETFAAKLSTNHVSDAIDVMNNTMSRVAKIGDDDRETLKENEALEIIQKDNDPANVRRVLFLGNPMFDHIMGGFEQQTLNGFIAPTNSGKSMMSHHLIFRAIKQKLHCFVAVVEDRKKSFVYRLMSRLSGVSMHRLKKQYKDLTQEEVHAVQNANKAINKYVKIEFMYGTTVDAIHKAALEYDLQRKMNDQPIPIINIVDYTGHISGKGQGEKMFEKMRNSYGLRKDFALKHDKIAFDFAQINREGSKGAISNNLITQNDLAGSYDLSQIFDNLISLNRSPEDIDTDRSRLHLCKARDGQVGVTLSVGVDFSKARYNMMDWELHSNNSSLAEIAQNVQREQASKQKEQSNEQ